VVNDGVILFSLLSLGFIGGMTHCSFMCAPIVIAQVTNRLEKLPPESFAGFSRIKNLSLISYHLGRIATYSVIGGLCSFLSTKIQQLSGANFVASVFLFIASLVFLNIAIGYKLVIPHKSVISDSIRDLILRTGLRIRFGMAIKFLFKNPTGLRGFFLGLILGFLPCGLLYSAFALASAISNPITAIFGMWMFGIATIPALFLSAHGGYLLTKIINQKILLKIVSALNFLLLLIMSATILF
jgi:sulfite exporter TauE/SafE